MAGAAIGRDAELAAIGAFLDAVCVGPRALVFAGEAGIGKTLLWEAGVAQAKGRVGRVLSWRGAEAEASLSFAALSELFGSVFDAVSDSLAAPRRRALAVALLLAEPGEERPDAHAIGLGVLDALRVLATDAPLVVALDDTQWLDPDSAGALGVALRRLEDDRVGVLATVRIGSQIPVPLDLGRTFPDGLLEQRLLGPLSLSETHQLLRNRLALELTRVELARFHEATAGNAFFTLEFGRELLRTDARPAAGRALRVPESLRGLLASRLSRLPAETVDVLVRVAALARPTVDLVTAACSDGESVLAALEGARREGVIELDDQRLRFAHPLLASVCYEQAPVWKRRAVHRALADVVADVEEQARHLALAAAGPDPIAAARLEAAAGHAAAHGATTAAAELAELAAELTGGDLALMRKRQLLAAHFHRLAGNSDESLAILDALRAQAAPGPERADILFELALNYSWGAPTAIALCDEARSEAGADDVRLTRILGVRSFYALLGLDIRRGVSDAREALAGAERTGDPRLIAAMIAKVGHAETYAADPTPGLVERGAEIEGRLETGLGHLDSPRYILARRLLLSGEVGRADAALEKLEADAAARGDDYSQSLILWHRSLAQWAAGRLRPALELADRAQELGGQIQKWHERAWLGRTRALVEADLGLADEARASARQGIALARELSLDIYDALCRGTLGRVELVAGNLEAAGVHLRDLPDRLFAAGLNDPALTLWADTFETLVGLGELERAHGYVRRHEQTAKAIANPWAMAVGARCRGLIAAAEGDFPAAFSAIEQALDNLDGLELPLERARTLLCFGVVRRRADQKRAAREALEQAVAIFEETAARPWADKARAELARIAGRRASSNELTETERRVAELAAVGRSNKEIAAELFMGLSTVEAHLSRVYRKLGISSRASLGSHLVIVRVTAPSG
jgi:DNA-binding CsgD family transcriptional regulator